MAGSLGCPPNLSVIKAFSFTLGSFRRVKFRKYNADMAELADALDSGSSEHYAHASSSLVIRITKIVKGLEHLQTLYFLSGACLKNALILIFQTSYSIIPLY